MSKSNKDKDPDPRIVYADIIDLPHWQSPKHPHMSLYDRSAQFASYKALSGYEDMVAEEARLTDNKLELQEHDLEILNQKLSLVADVLADGHHPILTFTIFELDEHKDGGRYVEITDTVRRVDAANRKVILMSTKDRGLNKTIDFDKIASVQGEPVEYVDDIDF